MSISPSAPVKENSREILDSFVVRDYRPPWWARNKHVNTIVGALFATPPIPAYRRERWDTEDGDFVDIDFLDSETKPSRGIVLLYHGLESNTNAPLTVRQAISLSRAGFDVAAVSFRGCSGEDNRTPGAYHLGFTKDIRCGVAGSASRRAARRARSEPRRPLLSRRPQPSPLRAISAPRSLAAPSDYRSEIAHRSEIALRFEISRRSEIKSRRAPGRGAGSSRSGCTGRTRAAPSTSPAPASAATSWCARPRAMTRELQKMALEQLLVRISTGGNVAVRAGAPAGARRTACTNAADGRLLCVSARAKEQMCA